MGQLLEAAVKRPDSAFNAAAILAMRSLRTSAHPVAQFRSLPEFHRLRLPHLR